MENLSILLFDYENLYKSLIKRQNELGSDFYYLDDLKYSLIYNRFVKIYKKIIRDGKN